MTEPRTIDPMFSQLVADACEGADLSPGNPASAWAVVEIERLRGLIAACEQGTVACFQAVEHRTSNPILDELRAEVRALRSFPVAISALSCIDVFTKAADEIERLTAENDERLRRNRIIQEQNDRLRAALEQITETKPYNRGTWHDVANRCHEIAREALAGASDETDGDRE